VRALEVVDEPIALELAGALLGERVQRQPIERQLPLSIRTLDDAEVRVERLGRLLGIGRRRGCRVPERRASVEAMDLAALLEGRAVQRRSQAWRR
jgi:hypothetical protein